jgi:hypothetical protein
VEVVFYQGSLLVKVAGANLPSSVESGPALTEQHCTCIVHTWPQHFSLDIMN